MWLGSNVEPAGTFQCGVVATSSSPATAAFEYQSDIVTVPLDVDPSVYVTVTVPVCVPNAPAPRNASWLPLPDSTIVCPAAVTLSGVAAGTSGHVNATPPCDTAAPGVRPTE